MRRLKTTAKLTLMLWSFSLIRCTTMSPPPDVPVCEHYAQFLSKDPKSGHDLLLPSPKCMDKIGEPECGHCTFIMTSREIFIGEKPEHQYHEKPWSQLRRESVLVPAVEGYAPLSAYIINNCEKFNCSGDVQRFKIKLDGLNGIEDVIKGIPDPGKLVQP